MEEKYIIPPGNLDVEQHKVFYDKDDENNLLSLSYAQIHSLKKLVIRLEHVVSSLIEKVDFDSNEEKICEISDIFVMLREELDACDTYKYYNQYLTLPDGIIPFTHSEVSKILSKLCDETEESVALIKQRIKSFL